MQIFYIILIAYTIQQFLNKILFNLQYLKIIRLIENYQHNNL